MKKRVLYVFVLLLLNVSLFSLTEEEIETFTKQARVVLNQEINEQSIPGYVYFEGFDFNGYTAESDGIEPMLEVTLELLKEKYENTNQPFVFV